ncbi:ABC transporter ATP-binding protein [Halorussus halophilus]|uniref:ABC transporter ATP-binding protein n=1 Tax=Halorussus halophilus TaxID=2650975 RepID=UPI0013017588|nr:ABC transporter ATP-binding protein [Halorussus halophilus]
MLEVDDLRKEYGGFTAVEGSSFAVEEGEVFGVIGPNGAGKTTTLKMLAGLVEPTSGSAEVAGYDAQDPEMRTHLGFLPEESPLYEDMTPLSYLKFFADLYDVPADTAEERIHRTLDRLELDHRERRLGDMSKGMRRKVAIARSLVNDPDVLIYDEPASGLDPLTTNYIIEFTRDLAESGKTIIFSAHNLFHVESICDRLVVMNEGRIVARGSVEGIREEYGQTTYHVTTTVAVEGAEPVEATEPVEDGEPVESEGDEADDHYRRTVQSMDGVEETRELATAAGGEVVDIQTETPSLEDIFLELAEEKPAVEGRP